MSTPSRQVTSNPATPRSVPSSAPTGTWKHPRFEEITRRMEATTFGDRNIRTITWSGLYLITTFVLSAICQKWGFLRHLVWSIDPYLNYFLNTCRLLLLFNILYAFSPIIRKQDDLSDIPLTPSQRALLGLGPASAPASAGSQYITPPRYSQSPVSQQRSRSLSASPYSARGSPLGEHVNGSPYSASPLLHKAVRGGVSRRLSYGSPSPLNTLPSTDSSGSLFSSTPSPTSGRGASVALNSRWLYERGKASPSMRTYYS